MALVTDYRSSKVVQSGKQPLDFPAPLVPPQLPAIPGAELAPVAQVGCNYLDPACFQACVQRVTVIRPIDDQPLRPFSDQARRQPHFMRASTHDAYGDRKTRIVCHYHELRTFAPLGLPHFATTKAQSMKHSFRFGPPRGLQVMRHGTQNRLHKPSPHPALESTTARLVWRVSIRQVFPGRTGTQDPQNAV
ncbi:hypothetical protein SAMN05660836_00827 [Thermodesulforhabdus norvegica]|uniref:Uncharacterized protein n=1 Tax=Thermodesulforhabdus norvegica TaxID=39841 RepID=A0A1I4S9D2_9BACT|nr:hypothetical protein SAMN05660836_00827 [Thermodesulforhabdus norvegica]